MIKSCKDINESILKEIYLSFEKNKDFQLLKDEFGLEHNVLWGLLYNNEEFKEDIYDLLCQINIEDEKVIFISDTHYCSKYEKLLYSYIVLEYAIKHNIHLILHGGDVIESRMKARRGYNSDIKQARYFVDNYPKDSTIKTIAVYGNHDYRAINRDNYIRTILESRNDVTFLGFKKVYLKWCGNVISLQHDIEKFKLNLPTYMECISYKGHSHFYHEVERKYMKSERIYIPTLSDDISVIQKEIIKNNQFNPGFLVAEMIDNQIITTNYLIDKYNNIIENGQHIKKLKKNN